MGENFFHPIQAGYQPNVPTHIPPDHVETQTDPEVAHEEEEPYTIKCICDFDEDDGNTVLCERCDTWQHISCYYFPTNNVPDNHFCVDCAPRALDRTAAQQRQRGRFEPLSPPERSRQKRAPSRTSHKKRLKEPRDHLPQQNGFGPHDSVTLDRLNGNPRDQPPPLKRSKTSHRQTPSISLRRGSTSQPNGLPVTDAGKLSLADCPPNFLSAEFIKVHQPTEFVSATTNTHLSIDVAMQLSQWLDDKDEFLRVTHGRSQEEIFKQFPQAIEDIEPTVVKHYHEDKGVMFHGSHPVWPYLTVEKDLLDGELVGEVRGGIGLLEDYKADPANNWDRLRHPEHFVFFHPWLPIYIDCRAEGTLLRHARRSCRPNTALETIITGERECRYCFTAIADIPQGAEITIRWDLGFDEHWQQCLAALHASNLSDNQAAYLVDRVSTVLAHFGGCACDPRQGECLMARFDHRAPTAPLRTAAHGIIKKGRKGKRAVHGVILQNPSRSGSEAIIHDEDRDDARSTSRSSRSKTREPSPGQAAGQDNVTNSGNELSERERKKLLQQERLFNKMEHEEQHGGQRKKKRASGSNLNTPAVNAARQSGRSNQQPSVPATPAVGQRMRAPDNSATSYFLNGRAQIQSEQSPQSASSPSPGSSHPPTQGVTQSQQAKYVDASTQTEIRAGPVQETRSDTDTRLARHPHQRFLTRSQHRKVDFSRKPSPLSQPISATSIRAEEQSMDVEMKDVDSPQSMNSSTVIPDASVLASRQPHPPVRPSAPPWSPESSARGAGHQQHRGTYRDVGAGLRVEMPPSSIHSTGSLDIPLTATPGGFSAYSAQSPHLPNLSAPKLAPLITPGGTAMADPSPVKKKMSLSAYTARTKTKTPGTERPPLFGETEGMPSTFKQDSNSQGSGDDGREGGSSPAAAGARPPMKDAGAG